jgi:hypothetical protein
MTSPEARFCRTQAAESVIPTLSFAISPPDSVKRRTAAWPGMPPSALRQPHRCALRRFANACTNCRKTGKIPAIKVKSFPVRSLRSIQPTNGVVPSGLEQRAAWPRRREFNERVEDSDLSSA